MKYKNILEEIKSFQEEIPKKSAKMDFTDKISDAKIKIDALYNFAFYDLEYKVANYNKLLVDYSSRRKKNKKYYLTTILFNDLSKLILQDVNEYKEKQKYITELINFFKITYTEITNKKCEIYRYADTFNLIFEENKEARDFTLKIIEYRKTSSIDFKVRYSEISRKSKKTNKNILETIKNNISEIQRRVYEKNN